MSAGINFVLLERFFNLAISENKNVQANAFYLYVFYQIIYTIGNNFLFTSQK